jgi:hypothetical protein
MLVMLEVENGQGSWYVGMHIAALGFCAGCNSWWA